MQLSYSCTDKDLVISLVLIAIKLMTRFTTSSDVIAYVLVIMIGLIEIPST